MQIRFQIQINQIILIILQLYAGIGVTNRHRVVVGKLVQISCKCWWFCGKHSQRGFALTLGGASIHLECVCTLFVDSGGWSQMGCVCCVLAGTEGGGRAYVLTLWVKPYSNGGDVLTLRYKQDDNNLCVYGFIFNVLSSYPNLIRSKGTIAPHTH